MTTLTPRRDDKASAEQSPEAGAGLEPEQERCLAQRAVGRDAAAFAELYDRHAVRVYRHIYYMVDNRCEAEDLAARPSSKHGRLSRVTRPVVCRSAAGSCVLATI
jgi:hypothetical protein